MLVFRTIHSLVGSAFPELLLESDTSFFVLEGDMTFSFEENEKASPTMTIEAGPQKFVAKRVM